MKKVLFILCVLFAFYSKGQTPTGVQTRFPALWLQLRDTLSRRSSDTNCVFIQPSNHIMYYYGIVGPWRQIGTFTGSGYLLISDTSAMLNPYLRKSDTAQMLSNRLKISDTATMLSGYTRLTKFQDSLTAVRGRINGAGVLSTGGQPNITSVGSLTRLTVSGNATIADSLILLPKTSATAAYMVADTVYDGTIFDIDAVKIGLTGEKSLLNISAGPTYTELRATGSNFILFKSPILSNNTTLYGDLSVQSLPSGKKAKQLFVDPLDGTVYVGDSTGISGGPYLPLTGGTLTGGLSGTTATFNAFPAMGGNTKYFTMYDAVAGGVLKYADVSAVQGYLGLSNYAKLDGSNQPFTGGITLPKLTMTTSATATAAGQLLYNSASGTTLWAKAGSVSDFTVYNNAGTITLAIPTGTTNIKLSGTIDFSGQSAGRIIGGGTDFAINNSSNTINMLLFDDATANATLAGTLKVSGTTTTTDSSTYKPFVMDASGNTRRFTYWPGGGGTSSYDSLSVNYAYKLPTTSTTPGAATQGRIGYGSNYGTYIMPRRGVFNDLWIGNADGAYRFGITTNSIVLNANTNIAGSIYTSTDGIYDIGSSFPQQRFRKGIFSDSLKAASVLFSGSMQLSGYGAGALTTDASGNVTASSDIRLKYLKGGIKNATAKIMGLNPQYYKWRPINPLTGDSTHFDLKNTYISTTAQSVQKMIPEAVGHMKDGSLTVQDRGVMAVLIAAFQEQQKEIESLKKEIEKLHKSEKSKEHKPTSP